MLAIILFFFIAFIAAAIASITGFGSATILIPFASLVIDLKQAIVLVAFFHFFSNVFRLITLRRSVDKRLVLVYGGPSIVFAVIGAWLFGSISVEPLATGFACFIIIFAAYSLINPTWSLPDRNSILVFGGTLSGLTAGLIGLGGAIRSMFLISTKIEKEMYIATAAAIAAVVDISRISVYMVNGNLDSEYYWYVIPLIAIAFIGTRVGTRVMHRLPELVIKRAVLSLLILVGLKMLLEQIGVL